MFKNIRIRVKSIEGKCPVDHKVGDTFYVENHRLVNDCREGLCVYALSAMIPYLTAYYRETPDNDWINKKKELQCPDNKNTVIFEIERY